MPEPLTIALIVGGYYSLRPKEGNSGDSGNYPDEPIIEDNETMDTHSPEFAGWRFPVPAWGDYVATRSQEYKPATHHGVDIMYPRSGVPNAVDKVYPAGSPNGSRNYFMPDGVPVLCPRGGTVWSTGVSKHGPWCVIDCGKPIAIYMVHFDTLLIANSIRGTRIEAGQMIGTVGFSPADGEKLKHLHIEVWRNGTSDSHVDPWPYLKGAQR